MCSHCRFLFLATLSLPPSFREHGRLPATIPTSPDSVPTGPVTPASGSGGRFQETDRQVRGGRRHRRPVQPHRTGEAGIGVRLYPQGREKTIACVLAAPTRGGAELTVLVVFGMALTLSRTRAAGCDARLDLGAQHRPIRLGLPR